MKRRIPLLLAACLAIPITVFLYKSSKDVVDANRSWQLGREQLRDIVASAKYNGGVEILSGGASDIAWRMRLGTDYEAMKVGQHGEVSDVWGHPLWIKPLPSGRSLLFWSFGPDGKDDDGHNDDIAFELNPNADPIQWPPTRSDLGVIVRSHWPLLVFALACYGLLGFYAARFVLTHRRVMLWGATSLSLLLAVTLLFVWAVNEPLEWSPEHPYWNHDSVRVKGTSDGTLEITLSLHENTANCLPYLGMYTPAQPQFRTLLTRRWLSVLIMNGLDNCLKSDLIDIRFHLAIPLAILILPVCAAHGIAWKRTRTIRRRRASKQCIKCGYDLKGLSDPRCPECGTVFCADDAKEGTCRDSDL